MRPSELNHLYSLDETAHREPVRRILTSSNEAIFLTHMLGYLIYTTGYFRGTMKRLVKKFGMKSFLNAGNNNSEIEMLSTKIMKF